MAEPKPSKLMMRVRSSSSLQFFRSPLRARERIVNPSIGVRLPGPEPVSSVPSVTAALGAPTSAVRVQILGGVPSRWQRGECAGLQNPSPRFNSGPRLQFYGSARSVVGRRAVTAQISGQNRGIAPSRYRSVAGQSPCKRPTEVRSHPTGTSSSEAPTWTTSRLCRKSPRRWARNCSVVRCRRWGLAQRPVHPALTRATRVRISNPLPFRRIAQEGIAAFEAVLFGSTPKSASTRHRLPARPPPSQGGRVGFDPHWRDQYAALAQIWQRPSA